MDVIGPGLFDAGLDQCPAGTFHAREIGYTEGTHLGEVFPADMQCPGAGYFMVLDIYEIIPQVIVQFTERPRSISPRDADSFISR